MSSRSPRSRRTERTPAAGQNVWTIQAFASALTSPGVQSPGSIPPSTVGSRNSIRAPLARTDSVFSEVASAEM